MKWLKKFEELSPELIRRAGNKYIAKGHSEKGMELLDKSYSGSPFNVWITNSGNWLKRLPKGESYRSEPASLTYNFSNTEFYFATKNYAYELRGEEMDVESLVDFWKQGKCNLGFTIDFLFKPTKETIKSLKLDKSHIDSPVGLFSINFIIHDKIKDEKLKQKLNKDSVYLQEYFNNNKDDIKITLGIPYIESLPGGHNEYGIFSDRKSALNFRNNILPKVIDEQGDKIMEILSLINIKADKADEILNFYKKVKVNNLYRSEIPHYVNISSDVARYFYNEEDIRS